MTIPDSGFMMENGSSCLPCTPDEEKRIVAELTNESESQLKEGNVYFLISTKWYRIWQVYVGQLSYQNGDSRGVAGRPGPIDNSDIVENVNAVVLQLKKMLVEEQDYVLVPQEVWKKLSQWYEGGPALPRKMISQGLYGKSYTVEVYPLCLRLIDSRDSSETYVTLSRKAFISELYEKICSVKGILRHKARIRDYFNQQRGDLLVVSTRTLEEVNLQMDQDILLEIDDGYRSSDSGMDSTGNEFALVPLEPARSILTIAGGPTSSNGHSMNSKLYTAPPSSAFKNLDADNDACTSFVKKRERGGLVGLQNLGNTCFMNSSLQCLVHTPPFVDYFLSDYIDDINTKNPLGMKGELALAFGDLLRKLWSSGESMFAPRLFKGKLARFAPQFSGYNQHDSQELLAFLLDGLHEDLNRVKQKPYIETKDSDGRPDEEVADECWKNHKARNDSLIVDVCQGQYKSTLVCPDCGKISITFDPFMYLSLPLPSTMTRSMTVTVFYSDGSRLPMPYSVTVPKQGCYKDLSAALSTACCLNTDETLLLAEVYENKIYRYLQIPSEPLSSIKDEEHIVAYRLPKNGAGTVKLEVLHGWQENCTSQFSKAGDEFFGTPLVTFVSKDRLNGSDIEATVSQMMLPLRKSYIGKANGLVMDECKSVVEAAEEEGFQLFLTDERDLKALEADTLVHPQPVVKVLVVWRGREKELYDASYLKDLPDVHKTAFSAKKTRQEAISLFSCLEAFLVEEPLGPDDMWYCPHCKEHRQANKKLDLWTLPDVIVFHLKRFTYNRYIKNKLDTFVNFPIHNLDLNKYVKSKNGKSYVYELYAISNHYGGLGGGHYTAYAKLTDENKWYHFDDSHVSPVSESEIKTSAAYVLFYQRVEAEPKSQSQEGQSSSSV